MADTYLLVEDVACLRRNLPSAGPELHAQPVAFLIL